MLNNEVLDEFDLENILLWKRVAGTSPEEAQQLKWKDLISTYDGACSHWHVQFLYLEQTVMLKQQESRR